MGERKVRGKPKCIPEKLYYRTEWETRKNGFPFHLLRQNFIIFYMAYLLVVIQGMNT